MTVSYTHLDVYKRQVKDQVDVEMLVIEGDTLLSRDEGEALSLIHI